MRENRMSAQERTDPERWSRCRIALACVAALVCIGLIARIAYVNLAAPRIPVDMHALGEEVTPGEAFLSDKAEDYAGDYTFCITEAKLMTPNEYLNAYAKDGTTSVDRGDERSVLAVTLRLRNDGTEAGGIDSYLWKVVPSSKNASLDPDESLWIHTEPEMEQLSAFALHPGQSWEFVIPFVNSGDPPFFEDSTDWRRLVLDETSYEFILTNMPVSKRIAFHAA